MAAVHAETLRRAAQIIGDDKKLAETLGITPEQLAEWKAKEKPVPEDVFLKCVDIVVSDAIRSQSRPDGDNSH